MIDGRNADAPSQLNGVQIVVMLCSSPPIGMQGEILLFFIVSFQTKMDDAHALRPLISVISISGRKEPFLYSALFAKDPSIGKLIYLSFVQQAK
jgi:hypothetical protein